MSFGVPYRAFQGGRATSWALNKYREEPVGSSN